MLDQLQGKKYKPLPCIIITKLSLKKKINQQSTGNYVLVKCMLG